jgi:hypothetical protein
MPLLLLLSCVAAIAAPSPAALDGAPDGLSTRLTIAVEWRTAVLPAQFREAALEEAAAIWQPYRLCCRWVDRGAEVTLTIDDEAMLAGPHTPFVTSLGWVAFLDGRPDRVLHVSVPGVRQFIRDLRVGGQSIDDLPARIRHIVMARVLGRAAAHEIGHYLLASAEHSRYGLMRPTFGAWEAASPERVWYRLEPIQVRTLESRTDRIAAP